MPNLSVFITFFLLLLNGGMVFGNSSASQQRKQMLGDFDFITGIFEISYAPLHWKSEHFGWNLETEREKAKQALTEEITPKAFQRIIKDFCMSTKDYHVAPDFYSTELANLPFGIKSAEGNYFVSYIDDDIYYHYESFPLSVGDQILLIDGRPIAEAVDEFRLKEIGSNFSATDQALAEFYFTTRFGSLGHEIPKGEVELTYCKPGSRAKKGVTLDWNYHFEEIVKVERPSAAKFAKHETHPLQKNPWQKLFMTSHCFHKRTPRFHTRTRKASNEDMAHLFGSRKGPLPELGTILWESEGWSEFHAYLFLIDDDQVGAYVRIPSYYVDEDYAAMEFEEIIELFEEVSDVLVIDQMNNGGGSVLYLYALLSMLTDRELELPKHRMMLTQEDLYVAIGRLQTLEPIKNDRGARKKFGPTVEGFLVNHKFIKSLQSSFRFTIDQWNAGKLLTDYSYLYGIEKISPHPEVRYTKPILVLINSLNFSAADFFPAIMQDNKRAKLMGTRTAGAGGYIERISFRNMNGIDGIDVTASFSLRSNGVPIENFGVEPDIFYEVSQEDLQNNYGEYKQNILKEIKNLILE